MKRLAILLVALVVAALAQLPIAPAFAAPPANDTFAGAVGVGLGFSEELDTSEATTDADDQSANQDCGAPATDASVWYSFTAAAEGGVVVDVSASDYSAGVIVMTGTPGSFAIETCGPGTVGFSALAGTVYHVLAFDDQFDGGGNGGLLRISFNEAPPPPTLEISVDPIGFVNPRTGEATLTGSFTCTNADFVDIFGDVKQQVGRFTVRGFFFLFADGSACTGDSQPWSATVIPADGKFAGGKAATVAFAFACGAFECAAGFAEQTVMLRGVRK